MACFLALCTFCDFHGPSVVLVTHPLETDPGGQPVSVLPAGDQHQASGVDLLGDVPGRDIPRLSSKGISDLRRQVNFREDLARRASIHHELARRVSLHGSGTRDRSSCNYCSSLSGGTQLLISKGPGSHTSFVSTQYGLGEAYSLAKDAAVKSISCEVVENRTGRIIFTNGPTAATVLAITFRLPDKNARGFQRYFSLVVGTKMRGHMVRSWPTISQDANGIIELLESKCGPPISKKDVKELSQKVEDVVSSSQSSNNLKQLTRDESIFVRLHQKFCALLAKLESVKTENIVIGSPVQCTLTFDESRILLLTRVLSSLARAKCAVLMHNLLSGHGLEIRSPDRESGRTVADALAALLPNNKKAEPVYFANVVLSPLTRDSSELGLVNECLVVHKIDLKTFSFINERCDCKLDSDSNLSQCNICEKATSSRIVMKLVQLLHSSTLNPTILHTKLLTTVEATLNHAKIWSKLKSQYEETKCLKPFGFCESDKSILDFYKLFIRR